MMQLRDKRRLQKKARTFLPLLVIAIILIAAGTSFILAGKVVSPDNSYVSFTQSGEITLTVKGKDLASIVLEDEDDRKIEEGNILIFEPEAVPFYIWSFENGIYGYSNERKTLYEITRNEESISYKVLYSFSHLEIKDFKVEGNTFYFVPADNSSVFSYDGKTFCPIVTGKYIENFDVRNGKVSVCAGDTLFLKTPEGIQSVYLGDRTFDIKMDGKNIYLLNNFGEEIGKALIHRFDYSLNSLGFIPVGNAGEIYFTGDKIISGQNLYDLAGEKIFTFKTPLSEVKSSGDLYYGGTDDGFVAVDVKTEKEVKIPGSGAILLLENV